MLKLINVHSAGVSLRLGLSPLPYLLCVQWDGNVVGKLSSHTQDDPLWLFQLVNVHHSLQIGMEVGTEIGTLNSHHDAQNTLLCRQCSNYSKLASPVAMTTNHNSLLITQNQLHNI